MEALFDAYWPVAAQIIALATIVTTLTPNRADNLILDNVLRFLNLLAGNVLKNKNRPE